MTKILVTGRGGQVGWELERTLATLGDVVSFDRNELDLQNSELIVKRIRDVRPTIIVNPAAYTAVDKAESEPDLAMKINGEAVGVMAEEAKKLNAILVHYSTDYVFNGSNKNPYLESEPTNPLNVYGKSKLLGETNIQASGCKHLILRTSWVYGKRSKNFLLTMLRLAKEKNELKVVSDQIGAPTWSRLLAEATAQILTHFHEGSDVSDKRWGIYHLTSSGQTSWHGFAESIFRLYETVHNVRVPILKPIATKQYPTPAKRPLYSVLSNEKTLRTFGISLPSWERGLELCLKE